MELPPNNSGKLSIPDAAELEHFRSIFELAMLGTAHLSLKDSSILWANPAFARILGYTVDEVVGRTVADLSHPDEMPFVTKRISAFLAGEGKIENVERRCLHKDGHYVWVCVSVAVNKDADGNSTHLIGVIQDITERKTAEMALRESEAKLRFVMELGRIGMWELDIPTAQNYWSPTMRELCGVSDDYPTTSENFWKLVHPDDLQEVMRGDAGLVKGQTVFPAFRIVRPDGTVRWLQNIGQVRKEGSRLMGVLVDVTEAKEAERLIEQQKANIVAASKMSALGEMAAGLAHEINNPVAIIHGHATLLKHVAQHGGDPEVIRKTAEVVEQTADRISKITRSLLAFARDAGQDPFELTAIKALIGDTAEFCRQRFQQSGVQLTIAPLDASLKIECRPGQISQVLLNLLNNAFDAVEDSEKQEIQIEVVEGESTVEISVADSGPGIPLDLQGRIFQPFFTTKEVGRGTGLGLSVATGIVQSHGGKLAFETSPAGTRFIVSLPKRQRQRQ